MNKQFRFAVLGPVRAWRGAQEIELGPPQQRVVLAALLLAEGSQVTSSALIDAVWGTNPPASALTVLRVYIHGLRKALKVAGETTTSAIRSIGSGYQLHTSPDQLDVTVCRELLAQAERARRAGDTKGSVERLREALGPWQKTALAGVRGEYAKMQRRRLGELRLSAETARLSAELSLGARAETAAELTGLLTEHPLDERVRELLMLALYRSGRQAAALETYREAQTLLLDELGIDPGPALQKMYRRVLRADARLLAPAAAPEPVRAPALASRDAPPVPAQLPPGLIAFVGRDAELAQVAEMFSGGTVVVSAIAGMAGVGKTAFAVHWARQIATHFPDGQLFLNLRGFDPVGPPVTPEHALRFLLESLGVDTRGLPQDVDALASLYRTRLTGKHILLLLDNARDAAQVRPLLPGTPNCLVIVTSRSRLTGLVALDGAYPLSLDVLSPPEARALLTQRLGHARIAAEPQAVEEIIVRCARLPLALAVIAARAATRPVLSLTAIADELREHADGLDAFHDGDTAADIRAVFSWSYHALTPAAAHLFRRLALHPGPNITRPAAASLAGLTIPDAKQLLAELIQTHLVDEVVPGRYASHDLLRVYAAELDEVVDAPGQVQAARIRMLDHYLHTAREATAVIARARTLIAVLPAADGVQIEEFAADAAKATAWFTAEQAVLLAVVEHAAAHQCDVHTWQLVWAIGKHLHRQGLWRELEAAHRTAMDSALRLGDRIAQAHVHHGLATAVAGLGRIDEARVRVERAIELFTTTGDPGASAGPCYTLAWIAERQGDLEASLSAAQQALALNRVHDNHSGDDSRRRMAIAAALNATGWVHSLLGQNHQALDHCRQALALHQDVGDNTNAAHTWDSIGLAHHQLGQYDEAVTCFRNALALYRQLGDLPWLTAGTLKRLGDTHLSAGHPDKARVAWTEGLDIMKRLGHIDAESLLDRLHRLGDGTVIPEGVGPAK